MCCVAYLIRSVYYLLSIHRCSTHPRWPPTPTLFPYTTLFRSHDRDLPLHPSRRHRSGLVRAALLSGPRRSRAPLRRAGRGPRSEEHTSELQSPCNLVCRLLLEQKKPYRGARLNTRFERESIVT